MFKIVNRNNFIFKIIGKKWTKTKLLSVDLMSLTFAYRWDQI